MRVKEYVAGGSTRCVQAAFRMVVLAFAEVDPGEEKADQMTGFVEGRGTWQFRMLLALADYGLNVIDHEEFDVEGFLDDPETAIRKQVGDDEAAQGVIAETDCRAEQEALRRCVTSPRIKFIESVPSMVDLEVEVRRQRLVMVNVNRKVLQGEEGREGHILILEEIDSEGVTVHDPGPKGGLGLRIDRQLFEKAWTSPSEKMANYISVWSEG